MPRDANGVYSLPPSYHVQTGDTLLPIQHNPPFEDVANALTNSVARDGRTVMTGNLQMGGNKVTNVAPGTNNGDALNVLQLRDRVDAVADFATVADMLSDNNQRIGYAGSGARGIVAPGQIITAQGFRYEVVASDATAFDVETAGGVRLELISKPVDALPQALTPEEQEQARENIGIGSPLNTDKWLLIADSQPILYPDTGGAPDNGGQVAKWRDIQDDIATTHPDITQCFFDGDLVHRGMASTADAAPDQYYLEDWLDDITRIGLPLDRIFELAGNHDRNYSGAVRNENSFAEYLKTFGRLAYAVESGNFLHVMLSQNGFGTDGAIDNCVFEWCRKVVRKYQKTHNIILHLHHPIDDTTTCSGISDAWRVADSQRFIDMFEDAETRVDLVVHGHNGGGIPGYPQPGGGSQGGLTDDNIISHIEKYDTWHVNVGLHLATYMNATHNPSDAPMSYCTAEVERGSTDMVVRRWNVETNAEVLSKEFIVPLRYPAAPSSDASITETYKGSFPWLPTVRFNTNMGTFNPSYTTRDGRFTLGEGMVSYSCHVEMDTNSYSGASGYIKITGLPVEAHTEGMIYAAALGLPTGLTVSGTNPAMVLGYAGEFESAGPDTVIGMRSYVLSTGSVPTINSSNVPASSAVTLALAGTLPVSDEYIFP